MSTSVSSIPTSDVCLACRAAPVVAAPASNPGASTPGQRPVLISPMSGGLPPGADPMALFDSLLVSVDITGPQMLRTSRYASQLYSEMQKVLMRAR